MISDLKMSESEISKDQVIEHLRRALADLQRKADVLSNALVTIDRAVDKAAMRYLSSTVPHGNLRFSEFLELLVCEIKRALNKKWGSRAEIRGWVKTAIKEDIEERIEKRIDSLMSSIKKKLSEYVTIPVLIRPAKPRMGQEIPPFAAMSVRGKIKHGRGQTPEDAYASLRERLILELSVAGYRILQSQDGNLVPIFQKSEPYLTEEIEGFKIIARIQKEGAP